MSVVTVVVLMVILYLSRHELAKAWELLGQADIWLLALLAPLQIIVYYAGGEMIFVYLRDKKLMGRISRLESTRIALELNLVNHIFPSGGLSGMSYTTWRMSKLGVSSARSTFAQMVRYIMGFISMVALLVLAVLVLSLDGQVHRYIVAASFAFVIAVLLVTMAVLLVFSSERRLYTAARTVARGINGVVRLCTFGRVKRLLVHGRVEAFFVEMRHDFQELLANKRLLIKPFLWGVVYSAVDVSMFALTFLALGYHADVVVLMIGYAVASMAGLVAFTPGGAGVYEAVMIIFLSITGMPTDVAIAGIVLARAILLTGTIVFGYIFYQHALLKYGKHHDSAT